MNTILTICPNCSEPQLADGKLIRNKVRCVSCDHIFICEKKAGPIRWVRTFSEILGGEGFEKAVSKVIFTYGVAVPAANQESFISHIGSTLDFGEQRSVKIRVDDTSFNVKISYFKNKRGEPSLHFLWKERDAIGLKLRERLAHAYKHFIINRSSDFLVGESVELAPSSRMGEYVLHIKTSGGKGLVQEDLSLPTRKKKGIEVLVDKDIGELLSELKI